VRSIATVAAFSADVMGNDQISFMQTLDLFWSTIIIMVATRCFFLRGHGSYMMPALRQQHLMLLFEISVFS